MEYGKENGSSIPILGSVISINEKQPQRLVELLKKRFSTLEGIRVAVLGFAFKPGTDDNRESPSLKVTRQLLDEGAIVNGFDPIAQSHAEKFFGDGVVKFHSDLETAICDVSAIIIVTHWQLFENIPQILSNMEAPHPVVIDGRRMI